ncbi:unnamed protein product, partial [Staurois parvus]
MGSCRYRHIEKDFCQKSREQLLKYHYIAANRYLKLLVPLDATLDGPDGKSSGWLVGKAATHVPGCDVS